MEVQKGPDLSDISANGLTVLLAEFKDGLNAYLATTAYERVRKRKLTDVIAFNLQEPGSSRCSARIYSKRRRQRMALMIRRTKRQRSTRGASRGRRGSTRSCSRLGEPTCGGRRLPSRRCADGIRARPARRTFDLWARLVRRKADRHRLCFRATRLRPPSAGLPANPTGMRKEGCIGP